MFKPESLKSRLALALAACLLLTLPVRVWITSAIFYEQTVGKLDHFLLDKLRFLKTVVAQRDKRVALVMPESAFQALYDPSDPEYFQMRYAGSGKMIYRSPTLGSYDLPRVGKNSAVPVWQTHTLPDGRVLRCVGLAFAPDGQQGTAPPALVNLVVAHDFSEIDGVRKDLTLLLWQTGVGSGLLLVGVGWWSLRRGLRPLEILSRQMETIPVSGSEELFSLPAPPTELQPVLGRLNELLVRVRLSLESERRFTANAAHELRNPLAAALSQVELALHLLEKDATPERAVELLHGVVAQQAHQQEVLDNLLLLARLEGGVARASDEPVEPAVLVLRRWKSCLEPAEKRQLKVSIQCPPDLPPLPRGGNLVDIAMRNLFANAVQYTPEGGEVRIAVRHREGVFRLMVENTNSGLGPEEVGRIFDAFWRSNSTTEKGQAGSGLGLSLVRAIATALEGSVKSVLTADDWVRITFEVPMNPTGQTPEKL